MSRKGGPTGANWDSSMSSASLSRIPTSTATVAAATAADPNSNFMHRIRQHERNVTRPGATANSYFTPTLVTICAKAIADDFPNQPPLDHVDPTLQHLIFSNLALHLPITVTVPRVPTTHEYWRSSCVDRWSLGKLGDAKAIAQSDPEGGWKRVYLERSLEDWLCSLDTDPPAENVLRDLEIGCKLSAPFIRRLHIHRLKSHINIADLFDWLTNLSDFRVSYGTTTVGMNFEFGMLGMRQPDCLQFAEMLRTNSVLTTLNLTENQIDNDKLKGLITGLVKNFSITHLDLSHNKIGDAGAKAMATLLVRKQQSIKWLNMSDNSIRSEGGRAFGKSLTMNNCLTFLNLSLNRLSDEGGRAVFEGVCANPSLTELKLSANDLGADSARSLCEVLRTNSTLTALDITGNQMGEEIGQEFCDTLDANRTLKVLDARKSGMREEDLVVIASILKKREMKSKSAMPTSSSSFSFSSGAKDVIGRPPPELDFIRSSSSLAAAPPVY